MSEPFIVRRGGERFFVWADGEVQPGYSTSEEKAIDHALRVFEENPGIENLSITSEKEMAVNVTRLMEMGKTIAAFPPKGDIAVPPEITVTTPSLPDGQVGEAYNQTLTASGGTGAFTWSVTDGTLPSGLSLAPSTGALTGTPTVDTTEVVTIQASDGVQQGAKVFSLAIDPAAGASDDPSANPNSLPLLGSHSFSSSVGLPSFERSGDTYPGDFLRLTIGDGQESGGSVKIAVGKTPDSYRGTNAVGDASTAYTTVEVAFEVRLNGTVPYKLFRSIVFPEPADWREAAVGHVWFQQPGGSGVLLTDPVRGVEGSTVVTTTYNDFDNFLWEGSTAGSAQIVDGVWRTVRIYQELNSSGNADGIHRVWIDGALDIEDTSINWVDEYDLEYGINSVWFEAFHNGGSPGGCTIDIRNVYIRGTASDDLAITTSTLPSVVTGASYNQTVGATGGTEPYTYSITEGSLSGSGLSLNPSTGAITGTAATVGTYNFTVQVEDDDSTAVTQAFSITVTAGSGTPDWEEAWAYASTAAMKSGIYEDSTTGAGGIELLTGLTGTPWGGSTAMRCQFLAAGSGTDHQVGATLSMGSWADTNRPREIWLKTWERWNAGWSWTGPYSGGGAGHKNFFAFDQEQTGSGRWENIIGIGGTTNQLLFAGEYGTGGSAEPPAAGLTSWVGAGWLEVWFHLRMGDPDGMVEMAVDGEVFRFGTGGDTDRGASYYFKYLALSRNQNNGKGSDQALDWGPVRVFTAEPGDSPF